MTFALLDIWMQAPGNRSCSCHFQSGLPLVLHEACCTKRFNQLASSKPISDLVNWSKYISSTP